MAARSRWMASLRMDCALRLVDSRAKQPDEVGRVDGVGLRVLTMSIARLSGDGREPGANRSAAGIEAGRPPHARSKVCWATSSARPGSPITARATPYTCR